MFMNARASRWSRSAFGGVRSALHRGSAHGQRLVVQAYNPPTVADTKDRFLKEYDVPIPAMYNTVIQELLVQQHFMRYNKKYQYDEIFALGIISVFNQILDEMNDDGRDAIFDAYIQALDEKPQQYRQDAEKLTEAASQCSSASEFQPDADGSEVQQILAKIAARTASNDFLYTKFFAIGLFRLLELTDTRDPKALEALVKGLGVKQESVNKDLLLYKGILSKMTAAKELMREFMEREKRKQAERDAEKAKTTEESVSEKAPASLQPKS